MKTFFLVRHGYTQVPEQDQTANTPLSDIGKNQAASLADRLCGMEIDHIFTSPFHRAIETASIVNLKLNVPISTDDRLKEISLWLTPSDLHNQPRRKYQKEISMLRHTKIQLHKMLDEVINHPDESYKNIVMVSHGNLMRAILAYTLKMDLETVVRLNIGHASISILKWEGSASEPFFRLDRFNDTAHLEEGIIV
ncbi:histidine phosphatase family protein [candidate division WWE3 bacterium]|nr:histidine phosphatase family protein [candidate division WWE3 bacterium]